MRYQGRPVPFFGFVFSHRTSLFIHFLAATLLSGLAASVSPLAQAGTQLSSTPTSVTFGRVWVGRSATTNVTIANSGSTTATITGDSVTGAGFSVVGTSMPLSIRAGRRATLQVRFTPQSAGNVSGKLTLIGGGSSGSVVVPLSGSGVSRSGSSGTGAGYINATPLTAQFGSVPVGTQNTQSVQLTNTGSSSVTISSVTASGSGFSVSGIATPLSIAAGATSQFAIGFSPATTGSVSGSVTIASTASDSSLSIATSGTGTTTTRVLNVSPTSVAFGNVTVGSSATRAITLTNSGNANLTISSDSVSGSGLSATGIGGGVTLSPGQAATLTASFAPQTAGSVTGSIVINSNATNGTSAAVATTGTGVTAVSHSVALQWQASGSSGVTGYYVYRGTSSGGPYTKLNGSTISGTSYTDDGVSSGTTYYYVVTALGSDGEESVNSNQVSAAIP
ncbi:MAG TPA: choice-of-anchor D domain-containing protein [Methylomirabilota bacterium]|nr:choice-of-anchor D domain-containing protein [Methylomirabilota bacterium]